MKTKAKQIIAVVVVGLLTGSWANAGIVQVYGTDFDSMTTGKLGGQDGWVDKEATYTETITTEAARSGTQSWWLGMNTGNTMVESVVSPKVDFAGETSCSRNIAPAYKAMSYEFWFKTKAAHADHENLYINSSLAQEASIRQTWFCIMDGDKWGPASQNNTSGQIGIGPFADDELRIVAYGQGAVSASGAYSPVLVWGDWYKVRVDAVFQDGFNAANDQVTYTLWDANLSQVWTATVTSWERPYFSGAYEPNQAGYNAAVNSVSFDWSTLASPAGIYIDDFKIFSAVPEPATMGVLAVGGLFALARRRRNAAA